MLDPTWRSASLTKGIRSNLVGHQPEDGLGPAQKSPTWPEMWMLYLLKVDEKDLIPCFDPVPTQLKEMYSPDQ